MPSLAFRKASICSRFSFSASCTLVVNPQHATRSRLILYWKLPPPSGSSCIGKDSPFRLILYWKRLTLPFFDHKVYSVGLLGTKTEIPGKPMYLSLIHISEPTRPY